MPLPVWGGEEEGKPRTPTSPLCLVTAAKAKAFKKRFRYNDNREHTNSNDLHGADQLSAETQNSMRGGGGREACALSQASHPQRIASRARL